MKTWKTPDMVALDVNETAHGSYSSNQPDADWTEPVIITDENGDSWEMMKRPLRGSGPANQ